MAYSFVDIEPENLAQTINPVISFLLLLYIEVAVNLKRLNYILNYVLTKWTISDVNVHIFNQVSILLIIICQLTTKLVTLKYSSLKELLNFVELTPTLCRLKGFPNTSFLCKVAYT